MDNEAPLWDGLVDSLSHGAVKDHSVELGAVSFVHRAVTHKLQHGAILAFVFAVAFVPEFLPLYLSQSGSWLVALGLLGSLVYPFAIPDHHVQLTSDRLRVTSCLFGQRFSMKDISLQLISVVSVVRRWDGLTANVCVTLTDGRSLSLFPSGRKDAQAFRDWLAAYVAARAHGLVAEDEVPDEIRSLRREAGSQQSPVEPLHTTPTIGSEECNGNRSKRD